MEPFTIDAPGLVLSTPTAQDIDKVFLFCQDPQIQRWTTVPSPYTYADAETFCTRAPADWRLGFDLKWGIRDPRGTLMGMITLFSRGGGNWEVGYWMGRPYRARGLMSRAVNAVLDAAFDPLGPIGAQRIVWRCDFNGDVPNWASWRVAWHVGFHKQGRTRSSQPNNGLRHDNWLADLLPDDPRSPALPWDGPIAHGDTAAYEQAAVPTDSVAIREGDSPEGFVARFHRLYGRPIADDGPNLRRDSLPLRMSLIAEEFGELFEAVYGTTARRIVDEANATAMDNDEEHRDVVATADALADLVYVIYGMALEMGIDLPAVLAEVQRSNMSKMGADHHPVLRADGKVLKGPDYFPPDIAAVLARSMKS
ncbi:GNAT family N-acetyltransferase [Propionibacterium freudenreichii]|uniref:Acetyltransferase, GNAT family n=1 Tax=Propionibacterium freudenreichii TaxID=1744 RepID=A0A0A8TF16_9ACTN|nr:GNAT family N-acetyltransferase [Propionibacterium freudenreichii]ARO12310.1 phosphoribosyl-ATP diphosphatase [Propionibacterium freudenreichii]MCT2981160.1 GNAT family N-acetyltransferase [Propionibacterium freudenreichii]MCT2988997.1 GNAT family N-acetyltransferase [Propionibacterium freudenreichii]MCT3015508.1 GNAT family N-acetyltransferase [Propionibacterium freudenreichii]MCT3018351.1 GNAT family N-acetyltransferase [Propionibacterium freudenreichii]